MKKYKISERKPGTKLLRFVYLKAQENNKILIGRFHIEEYIWSIFPMYRPYGVYIIIDNWKIE